MWVISNTGGISGNYIVFRTILSANEPKEYIIDVFDRTQKVVRESTRSLSFDLRDSFLDFDGGNWKAVFLLA